jgi:hypothetical protein
MTSERAENMAFEAEVRRSRRGRLGLQPGECQPQHYQGVDIILHELDGMA